MKKIFNILKQLKENGYEAYIVGGFVRDKILNKSSFDIDICTSAKREDIKKIFPFAKEKGLFCFSFILDNYNIEITSFRKEANYNGRRPLKVNYGNLYEDLQRRDFTINTLLLDENGHIIDYLNGKQDLEKKVIKVVGNSDKKIKDDTLRILRAIRFATILNFTLDEELEKAILKYSSNIQNLSIYRIRSELDKIIKNYNFKYGISLLKKFNLDKILNIKFSNNITYTHNYLGMYLQMDISDCYFKKCELKQITFLKNFLNKKLTIYDLYILKENNIKILDEINNTNYINIYNNLLIKKEEELNIKYHDIKDLLNQKKLSFNKLKENIIKEILNKKIKNEKDDIITYINNNY